MKKPWSWHDPIRIRFGSSERWGSEVIWTWTGPWIHGSMTRWQNLENWISWIHGQIAGSMSLRSMDSYSSCNQCSQCSQHIMQLHHAGR
jgi:hypothetical protein